MRISDWSSDVCSSDLSGSGGDDDDDGGYSANVGVSLGATGAAAGDGGTVTVTAQGAIKTTGGDADGILAQSIGGGGGLAGRSEEHTSELQSLMRISYAVFCLKKKNNLAAPDEPTTHTTL